MPKRIDMDKVLGVTAHLVSERGYDGATTTEIAHACGISEVTLFRRFGSKAELVTAAISHTLPHDPFGAAQITGDLRADLESIVSAYRRTFSSVGALVMALVTAVERHPELAGPIDAMQHRAAEAAVVIRHYQDSGDLVQGDTMSLFLALLAPVVAEGLWRRSGVPLGPDTSDPVGVVQRFLRGSALATSAS